MGRGWRLDDLKGKTYKDQCDSVSVQSLPPKKAKKPPADYFPAYMCRAAKIPLPSLEHRFHPARLWRFDAAWVEYKVAVEAEGGIWINGGHNRGEVYSDNMEKYNAAQLLGWIVLRYEPSKINFVQIKEALDVRGYVLTNDKAA